ncbi:MAG: pyrroloquinoline quinone biosynthesis protein PqqE [Methanoregula sp. PtaU1.Bin051]|nr:MAG: pyrroloquinoline quinone biosynthesis protein PqqE [Methanoregula sp. PtaU1.Bin051]
MMKTPFHVMLIPTLGCPARCSYCWSSEPGSPVMTIDTVNDVVEWLREFREDERVTFTFHGGEPLLAGADYYRQALPLLAGGLSHLQPQFALQSNLWLMTPELANILTEYHIPVGSSIDGPEEICDSQRGTGYFRKTMEGFGIARAHGVDVRFICTFTARSVKRKEEIFDFFLRNGFTMKLHPALPSLKSNEPGQWALDPAEYGELLVYLLDQYLIHLGEIEIMNINDLFRCVFTRHGSVCTFVDCVGSTFAIGPDGDIFPCYRFIGMPEYCYGNVSDRPSFDEIRKTAAWERMYRFTKNVDTACKTCAHIRYCRGGCPYNAIVANGGPDRGVDCNCTAYKRIFDEMTDRLNREMFEGPAMEMAPFEKAGRKPMKPGIMALMQTIASR